MPSPKNTNSLREVFAVNAAQELSRRENRAREQAAEARKRAAEKTAEEKAAAAKARKDAAYEKKIVKVFTEAKKIYDEVFGVNQKFQVAIEKNQIKIEVLAYPLGSFSTYRFEPSSIHGLYGKILTVKDGNLYGRSWGQVIDPQYRNYPMPLQEKELQQALMRPAMMYGSEEELRKLKKLVSPAENKKPQSAPKPRR